MRKFIRAVTAAALLLGLVTTGAATATADDVKPASVYTSCPAGTGGDYCRHDTGWEFYDGGCKARTVLEFWRPQNEMRLTIEVSDPYLFVACRVDAEVDFRDEDWERIPANGPWPAMACAVLDPTCASYRVTVHYADKATVRKRDAADVRAMTVIHHKA